MRGVNLGMMMLGILVVLLLGLLGVAGAISPDLFTAWGEFMSGPLAYALESLTGRVAALVIGALILAGPPHSPSSQPVFVPVNPT